MKPTELSDGEKNLIREEIESARRNGANETTLKALRKKIAGERGLTRAQVSAITAWKKGPDGLVLKKIEIVEEHSIAEHSRENDESRENNIDEHPQNTHVEFSDLSPAWVDFENSRVKEIWRQKEMEFIDRNISLLGKKPSEMKVLCTPGIKCYLEVRHLLERGFLPENITAVERERDAWTDFSNNCTEIGIKPVFGDLKNCLANQTHGFDAVLIDFLGQYCPANEQVIQQLPLSDKAFIAINMMGKREKKAMQRNMRGAMLESEDYSIPGTEHVRQKAAQALANGASFVDASVQMNNEYSDLLRKSDVEVTDEMRDAILWQLLGSAGIAHPISWQMPKILEDFPDLFPDQKADANYKKARCFHYSLETSERGFLGPDFLPIACRNMPMETLMLVPQMSSLALDAVVGSPKIVKLEKIKYLSKIGKTPSPFFTDLAIIERPRDLYRELQGTANFVATCAKKIAMAAANPELQRECLGIQYRDERFQLLTGKSKKNLHAIIGIRTSKYASDLTQYNDLRLKYPLSVYDRTKLLPRSEIRAS